MAEQVVARPKQAVGTAQQRLSALGAVSKHTKDIERTLTKVQRTGKISILDQNNARESMRMLSIVKKELSQAATEQEKRYKSVLRTIKAVEKGAQGLKGGLDLADLKNNAAEMSKELTQAKDTLRAMDITSNNIERSFDNIGDSAVSATSAAPAAKVAGKARGRSSVLRGGLKLAGKVPGLGMLGSLAGGGLALPALGLGLGAAAISATMKQAAFRTRASGMEMRGMDIGSMRAGGRAGLMGQDETLQMMDEFSRGGGIAGRGRISTMAKFAKGFGIESGQAGGQLGTLAGMLGTRGRGQSRAPEMLATAFAKGMEKVDMPKFLDNLTSVLTSLSDSLPIMTSATQEAIAGFQTALNNQGVTVQNAGNIMQSLQQAMVNPQGAADVFARQATGFTGGREAMIGNIQDLIQSFEKGNKEGIKDKDIAILSEMVKRLQDSSGDFNVTMENVQRELQARFAIPMGITAIEKAQEGMTREETQLLMGDALGLQPEVMRVVMGTIDDLKKGTITFVEAIDLITKEQKKGATSQDIINKENEKYKDTIAGATAQLKLLKELTEIGVGEGSLKALSKVVKETNDLYDKHKEKIDSATNAVGSFARTLVRATKEIAGVGENKDAPGFFDTFLGKVDFNLEDTRHGSGLPAFNKKTTNDTGNNGNPPPAQTFEKKKP